MKTISPLNIQDFATENHNLIYSFLHNRDLRVSEWYDVVAIGYMKAIHNYNTDKGPFSTFAYKCMENEVKTEQRKTLAASRIGDYSLIYFENCLNEFSDEKNMSFKDLLEDTNTKDFDNHLILKEILKELFNNLPKEKKVIILLYLEGYTQQEIVNLIRKFTQSYVSRIIKDFRKEILKKLELNK